MLYRCLKRMMEMADSVGTVEKVTMGDWIKEYKRIHIEGKCGKGEYELTLTYKPKEAQDGT